MKNFVRGFNTSMLASNSAYFNGGAKGTLFFLQFFLILNVNFYNYYVHSHAYERKPQFRHLDDFLIIDFPSHPCSQLPFLTFCGQARHQNKGKVRNIPWARSAPQPAHPRYIAPQPISNSYPAMVITMPRRNISRLRALLEGFPPCVSWIKLTLFFLCCCHDRRGRELIFDSRGGVATIYRTAPPHNMLAPDSPTIWGRHAAAAASVRVTAKGTVVGDNEDCKKDYDDSCNKKNDDKYVIVANVVGQSLRKRQSL